VPVDGVSVTGQVPDFLSLVTHELTDPLTSARGFAELLLDEDDESSPDPERRFILQTVTRSLDQLQGILGSLRVLNQLEEENLHLNLALVDANEVVLAAMGELKTDRWGREVSFSSAGSAEIYVDVAMFRQVVLNLIGNAIAFSSPASVIEIDVRRDQARVLVSVHNEGLRIPKHEAERIFERAVRLEPGGRGMGLGLFVAREVVELHHGRVWLETEGSGTTFRIALPAAG
jgi:signal transduction histidine kinase